MDIKESYEEKKIGSNKDLFGGLKGLSINDIIITPAGGKEFIDSDGDGVPDIKDREVPNFEIELSAEEQMIQQLKIEATQKLAQLETINKCSLSDRLL